MARTFNRYSNYPTYDMAVLNWLIYYEHLLGPGQSLTLYDRYLELDGTGERVSGGRRPSPSLQLGQGSLLLRTLPLPYDDVLT